MTKLNQIIAVEKGVKSKSLQDITAAHHKVQKPALLAGISRTYQPKDEEGEQLPPESARVQIKAEEALREMSASLTRLFDVTATKDWANCSARADVVVDGRTIVTEVPVSYLLFLEKQLTDLHTFVKKLPVLDASESWSLDPSTDLWKTDPVRTIRTKKVPRNHVKAEATDKHPAQVDVYYEDVPIGYWTTVKFSGALPARRVNELLERVEKLQHAVKFAREEANGAEVTDRRVGDAVFGYLFG
ncbi:hypothetical protein PV394_10740 [Streptomyces sp. NE06-03E]|uniref:Uncharacterized protein n=1 Tax=Streptomyces sp. gb1(2016) TaxID=1828321 RepID=A0A652KUZ3_9ACTN|nr:MULTISPECIES: hypothetical protein [unclassified Streptomyces]WSS64223.1 hypothetical protein OG284_24780 [Streptomyces sp. NBC_01177]MDX3055609.1 hypothetical protein [Streptomyces sp. NE06-03E]MDX3430969.1 hypothetical protein [Streptomyces sp. ME01-18a]MDX3682973.1 hypothetical protein [Streptomyces sp. AK04-4c]RPK50758.1 hypothetical protein EES40_05440 [Streptomyces sp. ADI93-02]